MLSRYWADLLSLLYPAACCSCDRPLRGPDAGPGAPWLCAGCAADLAKGPGLRCEWCAAPVASWEVPVAPCGRCPRRPPFSVVRVWASYSGVARKLVVATKYGGMESAARPLGAQLAELALRAPILPADAVVPVPVHWLSRRRFNHAELLAEPVARALGVPLRARALGRTWSASRQAALGATERQRNVERAFRCRRPRQVAGRRIVLVDDVFTTGATAAACTLALLWAGAASVSVLAATRADPKQLPHVAGSQVVA